MSFVEYTDAATTMILMLSSALQFWSSRFEKELAAVEGGAQTGSGTGSPVVAGSDDEGLGDADQPAPEGEVRSKF